jgi:outer membrane protein assembly factor BamB
VKRLLTRACLLAVGLALLSWAGAARADNWPQWRGPTLDGISTETNLPTEWSETKNLAWKLPLPGASGATPVVWGDRIFLTSEDDKGVLLLCVSTEGKELWRRPFATGTHWFGPTRDEGNQSSPSPSTDGQHVYAYAGTGDFVCFDFDGNEVWRFNVQERYGPFHIQWGVHTTPLLHGDRLYLQVLHSGAHLLVALDKATGKEVWKVQRQTDAQRECEQSYTSPVIWSNGKEEYLVTHGCDYAIAMSLQDGHEIWRLGDLNPKEHYRGDLRFVASPVAARDLIVVTSAKDGTVVGVKPDAHGVIKAGDPQEEWRRPRNTPDVPSPLVHDGLVYLCRERGSGGLLCLDAKDGKEMYSHRLPGGPRSDRYRASPVYADGKVYLTARDGVFTVVRAGPKFEALAENQLPDQFAASPAISNGRIYLRGFKALYAIGPAVK